MTVGATKSLRRAAVVVPFRRGSEGEVAAVYLVERAKDLRAWGGLWSFPGGQVEAEDGDAPLSARVRDGLSASDASIEPAVVAAAARELFEETGALVVRPKDASFASPSVGFDKARDRARDELLARGPANVFVRFLRDHGLVIDAAAFLPACRLITPSFAARRLDASFFFCEIHQELDVRPGELDRGCWLGPGEALELWRRRELSLAPPAVSILEVLARARFEKALDELRAVPAEFEGSGRVVAWAPGYELVPLTGRSLPPITPTTTVLVGGCRFIVIDPGAESEIATRHLEAVIERRLARGDRLEAVVLTHHHPDHIGGLEPILRRFRPPLWAHDRTASLIERKVARALDDGDRIELGDDLAGTPGWSLEALYTPGHAEGHIALHDARFRTLIAGDLVSTLLSVYVGSPGGSIEDYLGSLRRALDLDLEAIIPAHGAPSKEPRSLLERTIAHRERRLRQVEARLGSEPVSAAELAIAIYPEAKGREEIVLELVTRATRAALEWLEAHGRARSAGEDRWANVEKGAAP